MTSKSSSRRTADDRSKPVGEGDVELKLAHPIPAARAKQILVGYDSDDDLEVNQVIKTDRFRAQQFISGGLVQVDPEDKQAVAKVLGVDETTADQVVSAS